MKQTLKYIYERLLDNTKIAESKYAITIALASGVIVFASGFLSLDSLIGKTLSAGCIVFALISVLYGFVALSAKTIRIPRKKHPKKIKNLMFYKNIIRFDEHSYVEEIKKRYNFPNAYKPDEFDFDLARQVISLAKVVYLKFLYFNLSLVFLILSVICGVVLIILIGL